MDHRVTLRGEDGTLIVRVMTAIRQRITARALAPGARLPSIRGFAASMGVSKSTVVEAYERLAAEGAILSRRGSGFYVAGHLPPLSLADIGPRLDRAVDPLWVSRQSLEAGEAVLKPGCGWLPPSWMPEAALRRALRSLSRADAATLADYGTPLGLLPLRHILARRLAEHGIEAAPDQIMLTESGTQAIDLLCRFLIEPGDAVLVDDPCYFNFHALLRAHRAKIVGVPYTPIGPDLGLFEQALAEHRPRLYITNSALHNPTGATLSPVVAHRLLKLAEQAGLTIIEDDIFADFEQEPAPRLAAFDGLERVVQIGSFSKIALGLGPLRLHRGAARLDRGAGRSQDRHQLRRRAAFGRARPRRPEGRQLPEAHGGAARAAVACDGRDQRPAEGHRHRALDRTARRHVPLVRAAGRDRCGRDRAAAAGREHRHRSGQCLQPVAVGEPVPALQRGAVVASAHLRRARGCDGAAAVRQRSGA